MLLNQSTLSLMHNQMHLFRFQLNHSQRTQYENNLMEKLTNIKPTKIKQTAYTLRVRPFNRKSQTHLTHSVVVVGVEPDVYEFIHTKNRTKKYTQAIQHRQSEAGIQTHRHTPSQCTIEYGFMCATRRSSMATSHGLFRS